MAQNEITPFYHALPYVFAEINLTIVVFFKIEIFINIRLQKHVDCSSKPFVRLKI